MKTTAALAAQAIRKEVKAKFPGLMFKCTSENYSGGNSVRLSYTDQPKAIHEQLKSIAFRYQYGHFDGMTDSYNYTNKIEGLPQVRFVFSDNQISDAKRAELYQILRTEWKDGDKLPATYEEGRNVPFQGNYVSEMVWQLFTAA